MKIKKNMLDFPQIDYKYWCNNYSWEGFFSMRCMISNFADNKH